MPPTEQKQDTRLEAIVSLLEKSPTKEEFVSAFEEVVKVIQNIKSENNTFIDEIGKTLTQVLEKIRTDHDSSLSDLKGQVNDLFVKSTLDRITSELTSKIDAKLATVKDGRDGKKGDKGETGGQGRPANESAIFTRLKNEVESLIKSEVDKIRTELSKRPIGTIGGVSDMRIRQAFKYIAHTEQPVGLINGSNTTYTVKNDIWWIAGFSLNGEQIAQLPNFTYSGRTITFASALPSAYSGKDFECKYIG